MIKAINDIKFSTKLPAAVLTLGMVTTGGVGLMSYLDAYEIIVHDTEINLETALDGRYVAFQGWLHDISVDLSDQQTNPALGGVINRFSNAFNQIEGNRAAYLQDLYIHSNPHPIGQKEQLDVAADGSAYADLHAQYHPFYRNLQKRHGYYDVFLMNADGDIVYSVFKENDFATNMESGRWASSGLGEAFRKAKANAATGEQAFVDFAAYGPSNGAPASFMSAPVKDANGQFAGVVAYQMPVGKLNALMQNRAGMGETGQTYLVGADGFLRNDLAGTEADDTLSAQIDVSEFEGLKDHSLIHTTSLNGTPVGRMIQTFNFNGTEWLFVAEKDDAELVAPAVAMSNQILIQLLGAFVLIGGISLWASRYFTNPLTKVRSSMVAVADGKFDLDIPDTNRGDEIGDIARTLNEFKGKLQQNLVMEREQSQAVEMLGEALEKLMAGDLTHRIGGDFPHAFRKLKNDFNGTLESLEDSFGAVTVNSSEIGRSSGEISQAADDLSRRTENQAATLEETAAAIEQMTSSIASTADEANRANTLVASAQSNARESEVVVDKTVEVMGNIEKSSEQIAQIVSVIDEIAFQTNLLALNAGVEAARAGDAGRGFAVVASEVRALAQRSSNAAKEIKDLITASSHHVSNGVEAVNQTGEMLRKILVSVDDINTAVGQIASAAQEQSTGLTEINSAVAQLDQVTQQNAAMVEESTAASHSLKQDAEDLGALIQLFKIRSSKLSGTHGAAPRMATPQSQGSVPQVAKQQERVAKFAATQGSAALSVDEEDDWLDF